MTKSAAFVFAVFCVALSPAHAVVIGLFPGMDELVRKADAIVILRVDRHHDVRSQPTLYTTHECFVCQTLKGEIPDKQRMLIQLMDTRTSFATPFALHSTHPMFLIKKRSPNEPTEYRTIAYQGANVSLPPTGHEKTFQGETTAERIRSVLRRTAEWKKKDHEKEQSFLNQMITGSAEP